MPIIRISKEQLEAASKARETALQKDPEYRLHEERMEMLRQAELTRRNRDDAGRRASPCREPDSKPCSDRNPLEDKPAGRERERDA